MSKYYLLNTTIEKVTDKAIGVCVGSNGMISKGNTILHLEWIPKSQTRTVNNQTYIAGWIANQSLSKFVDWNNYIEIDEPAKPKKPRKTKEQKEQEIYDRLCAEFRQTHENETEWIEYWYVFDVTIHGLRFSRKNRLEKLLSDQANRLDDSKLAKLILVKENGNIRETIIG